jgi:hypothetical protein
MKNSTQENFRLCQHFGGRGNICCNIFFFKTSLFHTTLGPFIAAPSTHRCISPSYAQWNGSEVIIEGFNPLHKPMFHMFHFFLLMRGRRIPWSQCKIVFTRGGSGWKIWRPEFGTFGTSGTGPLGMAFPLSLKKKSVQKKIAKSSKPEKKSLSPASRKKKGLSSRGL